MEAKRKNVYLFVFEAGEGPQRLSALRNNMHLLYQCATVFVFYVHVVLYYCSINNVLFYSYCFVLLTMCHCGVCSLLYIVGALTTMTRPEIQKKLAQVRTCVVLCDMRVACVLPFTLNRYLRSSKDEFIIW